MKEKQILSPPISFPKKRISFYRKSFSSFSKNPMAMGAFFYLLTIALFAIFVPMLSSHTYYQTHLTERNAPPSSTYWFGTDELGRDIFVRIWFGARISLTVGIVAAFFDLILGTFIGSLAAISTKRVEAVLMRCMDILYALPHLLLVILLTVVVTPSLFSVIGALTITGWIKMARIVRGQVRQIQQADFVCAAIGMGASRWRILYKYLLPNCIGPILVTTTLTIPLAIFSEVFLSFLGLGVQAPIASWGTMASDGLSALRSYPWRLFFPASFICFTLLSFSFLGEGIKEVVDPRKVK